MHCGDRSTILVIPLNTCGRAALVAALSTILLQTPLLAQRSQRQPDAAPCGAPTQNQQHILQALNRFTFGPRPGEVAAVEKLGLKRWFNLQLNPGRIDDSALDARLAAYPAVELPLKQLEEKYPSPQRIRYMANGRLPLPQDPTARVIARDQIAFYENKLEDKKDNAGKEIVAPAALETSRLAWKGTDATATPAGAPLARAATSPSAARSTRGGSAPPRAASRTAIPGNSHLAAS